MQTLSVSKLTTTAPPLRSVRIAKGLTLRDTATRAHIDPAHLSRVERGSRQLSVDALYRLAIVLELRELAKFLKPYLQDPKEVA
jgi:transcriptional regulator with XRE-family HTH domain